MTLELTLRTDKAGRLIVTLDGQTLAGPAPLADLPALPALQAAPYDQGRALTRALGGDVLLARLQNDPGRILLLETDDAAAIVPWEFAALEGRQLLACRYAMLRLIDRPGALGVILPWRVEVASARLDQQAGVFQRPMTRKSRWLTLAVIAFGLGLLALGTVLIVALLKAT
ncbi:MAG: hypothetical protein SWK90_07985 [Chloroflexota bacterium]|nr:hypothetical protein [Chloroflexota bacterium]